MRTKNNLYCSPYIKNKKNFLTCACIHNVEKILIKNNETQYKDILVMNLYIYVCVCMYKLLGYKV